MNSLNKSSQDALDDCNVESLSWEPFMALAFLVPSIFSDLSAGVIRLYRNSVPFAKLNIIFIINYYIVEMFNFLISLGALGAIWATIICKLPMFLGTMVFKSMEWAVFTMMGLNIVQAALRMLIVLKFDQMMELEPEKTAKQLFLATQIIYIPITIINTVVDLKREFIPGYLGYLTGAQPSFGHPITLYIIAANIILALLATVFAYTFNTLYLKNKHALIIRHEIGTPQQNLISLKKLILGALVMTLLVIGLILIKFLIPPCNRQQSLPWPILFNILASVQLMLAKNVNAWNHYKQVLRIERDNLEFSSFNPRQIFGKRNRVSAIA